MSSLAGELFKVYGSIIIEDKDAIKSINNAEKHAKESAKAIENLGKKASEMGKAVVVGAGVAVTALFGMATNSAAVASNIDDASKRVGMSAEEFQKWGYAAKLSGIEQQKLEQIMKKQQTVFADASTGVKGASDTYKKLGIDIKGLTAGEAFNKAITALADMDDVTQRNAIANDLFGKSYADLAPLLGEGSAGIDALRQEAVDLGTVMSNDSVDAGAKFDDTLDTLKTTFGTVVAEIGVKVMPIFQKFADWIIRNMPTIKRVFEDVFGKISDVVEWVSDNLNWLLPILAGVLAGFVAFQIISTITSLFALFTTITAGASGAMAIFNAIMLANPIGLVAVAIGVLVAAIAVLWTNWDKVSQFFSSTFDSIMRGFQNFVNGIIDGMNWIIEKANAVLGTKIQVVDKVNFASSKPTTGTAPKQASGGSKHSNIQAYADGGIAYGESLAIVGEYGNVRSNPEVIAPLDKLQNILKGSTQHIDYDLLADKMAKALSKVTVMLDDNEVGNFVDKRILKGAV